MAQELTYPVTITPAEEGGFYVTSPVVSIFSQGETEEEALENAKEAILCHIEGTQKERNDHPDIKVVMLHVPISDSTCIA